MSKYRKKPVVIEAVQFTRKNWESVKQFTNNTAKKFKTPRSPDGVSTCIIPTLEGQHVATEGDWIIRGVNGEYYPCKPDIFEKTYEKVEE